MHSDPAPVRIANINILGSQLTVPESRSQVWQCAVTILHSARKDCIKGEGTTLNLALLTMVRQLCIRPDVDPAEWSVEVDVNETPELVTATVALLGKEAVPSAIDPKPMGTGRYASANRGEAIVLATLRAASHAGLLQARYRANNQKAFRDWAGQLTMELHDLRSSPQLPPSWKAVEEEALILEHFNRVASAAVITATNHPKQDRLLQLYDSSAWLFDSQGKKRASFTDTQSWLAWFPGVHGDGRTIREIVNSMPASPPTAIPWVVRTFENPAGRLRFRGAMSLANHDCLHALVGRGLQDQDEAFVLGFAMGTSKRTMRLEKWFFEFVISRLYPEPYRVPKGLLPAFRIGVECGQATGQRDLYRVNLCEMLDRPLDQARRALAIDVDILGDFFEKERAAIPGTVASTRL